MILVIDGSPASGEPMLVKSLACNYFVDAVTLRDKVIAIRALSSQYPTLKALKLSRKNLVYFIQGLF